jgi:hypothetical protein
MLLCWGKEGICIELWLENLENIRMEDLEGDGSKQLRWILGK